MQFVLARIILLAGVFLLAAAADAQTSFDPISAEDRLDSLEAALNDSGNDQDDVRKVQREASEMRATAVACVRRAESAIAAISSDTSLLGAAAEEEAAEVLEQRSLLNLQRTAQDARRTACRLVILRAGNVLDHAGSELRRISALRLSSQDRNSLRAVADLLGTFPSYLAAVPKRIADGERLKGISVARWTIIVLTSLVAFFTGILIRQYALPWADTQRGQGGVPALQSVLVRASARQAHILLAGAAAALGLVSFTPDPGLDIFALRLAVAVIGYGVGRTLIAWYTGPYSPGQGLSTMPDDSARAVQKRLHALVVALLAGFLIFGPQWLSSLPEDHDLALRSFLTVYLVASFIWVIRLARQLPAMRGRLVPLRFLLITASVVAVAADLTGFRNFANYLLQGVFATLLGGLVLWTILWSIARLVDGIMHGRTRASYQMRGWLGIRPDSSSAELGWLRLVITLSLWFGFGAYLVWIWDTTGNAMSVLEHYAVSGIPLSENTQIVPADFLSGIAAFGIIIALTAWIKARMEKRWLREMGMDIGSREALVTLGGYVGFIIAAIIGLIVAGVKFAGLALVAGALSVGIGFGLQNIVNNFVSGLILLFERPIKSGDFVSVGAIEGFVRQIRIRSTEIETLDRQNVIVPNSELVTSQVTNWVLRDPHGRVTVEVGVAYGSDTHKVKAILEEVAAAHPEVITKGKVPAPRALFMAFGDSSLNFELRVWIRQIEKRFSVISDINLAVDAAFRENKIEIPFPQRDLHVRSWAPVPPQYDAPDDDAQFPEQQGDDPTTGKAEEPTGK